MIRTKLCEMLGIDYPIFQGGMAWVATAELAVAVSEAGGLGIVGAGQAPAEVVRAEIHKVKAATLRPFGVNVMLRSPHARTVMEVVASERVPVVTTGAGNPGVFMPMLKASGTKVFPVLASVALAKRLSRLGIDGIVAEGLESGGHVGEITTMALLPQIVDAVDLPVIAAGGIADGRGLAAALALGAVGVQIGTRFVCASECTAHPAYKQAIIEARDRSTVVTGRPTGHPVRVIENHLARKFLKMEAEGAPADEMEKLGVGKLRAAVVDGDVRDGSMMAGQVAAMVKKVQPAREIIREIMSQADQTLERLRTL
ncbi:MAG: enoyl-[acyl-carrier-protein] reductase FabK [Firmicutes bacterium]|nr:enoyl-[acyl-carrier-protein] reductase FabK [Bacillota bacterium]